MLPEFQFDLGSPDDSKIGFQPMGPAVDHATAWDGDGLVRCERPYRLMTKLRCTCPNANDQFQLLFLWDAGRRIDFEYVGLIPPPPLAPFLRIAAWS